MTTRAAGRALRASNMVIGHYARERDALRVTLQAIEVERHGGAGHLLREGRPQRAYDLAPRLPPSVAARLDAFRSGDREALARLADERVAAIAAARDGEGAFDVGSELAFMGLAPQALALLRWAVDHRFCSTAFDSDPLLAALRGDPTLRALQRQAAECRQAFAAHRAGRARDPRT